MAGGAYTESLEGLTQASLKEHSINKSVRETREVHVQGEHLWQPHKGRPQPRSRSGSLRTSLQHLHLPLTDLLTLSPVTGDGDGAEVGQLETKSPRQLCLCQDPASPPANYLGVKRSKRNSEECYLPRCHSLQTLNVRKFSWIMFPLVRFKQTILLFKERVPRWGKVTLQNSKSYLLVPFINYFYPFTSHWRGKLCPIKTKKTQLNF